MLGTRFDPQLFFQRTENVALNVPAGELFGLLKKTLDLPAAWGALVTRETGDHFVVPAGAVVDGSDAQEVFFVRITPVDVSLREENLSTRDGYNCQVDVKLRCSVVPERSEFLLFKRAVLGSRRVVQADGIGKHLQPSVRAALSRFLSEQDADALTADAAGGGLTAAVSEALQAPCFAAGLILDAAPVVRLESAAIREVQQTRDQAARRLADHTATSDLRRAVERAQSAHLDHVASLLNRLRDLAASQPNVALPELIRTFSESQRGDLYHALLAPAAGAKRTRFVVAAVGDELLWFDPQAADRIARRTRVEGAVGPVRSIRFLDGAQGPALWLGAATGVYRLPLDASTPDAIWEVPGSPSVRGGFNSVAVVDEQIIASHSELGLWQWPTSGSGDARQLLSAITRGAKAVRNVQRIDSDLICSVDDRAVRWRIGDRADQPTAIYIGARAALTALHATLHGLFAGTSEGEILHWPGREDAEPTAIHRGSRRPAESVTLMQSHGVNRLVFTDSTMKVHARVLGESFSWAYEAGGQTLRRAAVSEDLVVAVNDVRDRLFLWHPDQAGVPFATIPIGTMYSRSIQDVGLVT